MFRDKRTSGRSSPEGDIIEWNGVTTLERRPDQSQGVEAYIHALGTNGNQERSPPGGDKIEWYGGGGGGGGDHNSL